MSKPQRLLALAGCVILVSLMLFGGCGVVLVALGMSDSTTPGPVESAFPSGDDDFLFVTSEGQTYVSAAAIVERGQPVALAGLWREDRQNFSLQLEAGASYRLIVGGSSSGGAATTVETGSWSVTGNSLRLTPGSVTLETLQLPSKHQEKKQLERGGPRDYQLEGLTLEYTPYGVSGAAPRRIAGLSLVGPVPAWEYEPSGQWSKTLRRALR